MNKPPRPPKGVHISMDLRRETLRVVQEGTVIGSIWRTPALGAQILAYDGTGSRVTVTRVLAVGLLAGFMRKGTGHVSVTILGRDGQYAAVKVKPGKAQELMSWAAEFNAWNLAEHQQQGWPYPPVIAAPQA